MTKILVTGATGTIGSQVVEGLLNAGASVRVGVRTPSKVRPLAERGVEIVEYDLEQNVGVQEAFTGVDRAFVLTPFVPAFETLTLRAVDAAKAAGVGHLVKQSAAGADPASTFWVARGHGLGDKAIAESGLSYTILRPTFFQDNILNFEASSIAATGTFHGASAHQPTAFVSSRDIAEVAAQALLHPDPHRGKTYELTGGASLTAEQLAGLLTEATGKTVRYLDLSPEEFSEHLRSQGVPEAVVEALGGLEQVKAQGWAAAVSPHVDEVLGRAPETYPAFIARNRSRLPQ